MNLEEIDALINILGRFLPIGLAVVGTAFGVRDTRKGERSGDPGLVILRLNTTPESVAQLRGRRRNQITETVFSLIFLTFAVAYFANDLFTTPPADTRAEMFANVITVTINIAVLCFYVATAVMYGRLLFTVLRSRPGTPTSARAEQILEVAAEPAELLRRCQGAIRRLHFSLCAVESEQGLVTARRYYFFNLYRFYADDITLRFRQLDERRCELTLLSDGIMPTFRPDTMRHRQRVQQLISLITE